MEIWPKTPLYFSHIIHLKLFEFIFPTGKSTLDIVLRNFPSSSLDSYLPHSQKLNQSGDYITATKTKTTPWKWLLTWPGECSVYSNKKNKKYRIQTPPPGFPTPSPAIFLLCQSVRVSVRWKPFKSQGANARNSFVNPEGIGWRRLSPMSYSLPNPLQARPEPKRNWDSGYRTQGTGHRTRDPGPRTQDSVCFREKWLMKVPPKSWAKEKSQQKSWGEWVSWKESHLNALKYYFSGFNTPFPNKDINHEPFSEKWLICNWR